MKTAIIKTLAVLVASLAGAVSAQEITKDGTTYTRGSQSCSFEGAEAYYRPYIVASVQTQIYQSNISCLYLLDDKRKNVGAIKSVVSFYGSLDDLIAQTNGIIHSPSYKACSVKGQFDALKLLCETYGECIIKGEVAIMALKKAGYT